MAFDGWKISKQLRLLFGLEIGNVLTENKSGVVTAESIKFWEIVVKSKLLLKLIEEFDGNIEFSELMFE